MWVESKIFCFSRSKLNFAIFQGVLIFKSSPQPNAPTDFLQTIRFGKLKVHGFQKYMSAKVPRGGGGGGGRVSISGPRSICIAIPNEAHVMLFVTRYHTFSLVNN